MRSGHVVRVAREPVADHFRVDFRPAALRMLIFLEHDDARAFAHDETVAVLVIGPAGLFGLVVEVRRQRPGLRETSDADRADGRLRATREHDVRVVVLDHARSVADRVSSRRAGGDDCMVGAHEAVFDGYLAGDQVDQAPVHEVRADPAWTLLVKDEALALDSRKATDPRTDRAAGA